MRKLFVFGSAVIALAALTAAYFGFYPLLMLAIGVVSGIVMIWQMGVDLFETATRQPDEYVVQVCESVHLTDFSMWPDGDQRATRLLDAGTYRLVRKVHPEPRFGHILVLQGTDIGAAEMFWLGHSKIKVLNEIFQ